MYERSVGADQRERDVESSRCSQTVAARQSGSFLQNGKRDGQQLLAMPFWFANSCFT